MLTFRFFHLPPDVVILAANCRPAMVLALAIKHGNKERGACKKSGQPCYWWRRLSAGVLVYREVEQPGELANVLVYPTPRELANFKMTSHSGQALSVEQLKGHWTLAFVGYTFCPDICPMTMATFVGQSC